MLYKNLPRTLSTVASAPIRKLSVDSSVPGSPVLTVVPSPTNNARPTLSWSTVTGAADYVVTLDGIATTVTAPTTNYPPASTLAETTHVSGTVAARTAAGNRGADAPPQSFLVDITAPAVASAQTRLNGQDKNGASATLTRNSVVSVSLTGFPDADIASMRVWKSTPPRADDLAELLHLLPLGALLARRGEAAQREGPRRRGQHRRPHRRRRIPASMPPHHRWSRP
ncbi:MAG: hypothetical protein QM765_44725 [Myxococcales bacterium]